MRLAAFFTILSILYIGCDDSPEEAVAILNEDLIYLSAEQVALTGRVVTKGVIDISDHGFLISTSENLSDPITVTLGERSVPGRFVGNTITLLQNTRYWSVAFAKIGGETLMSEVVPFTTLIPRITDFEPKVATTGEQVKIEGANFTNDTKVLFGDVEGEITDIIGESTILVRVPGIRDRAQVVLTVSSQGLGNSFDDPFEYVVGQWSSMGGFPFRDRVYREGFTTEGQDFVLFGLGDVVFSMRQNDEVFLFNKTTEEWTTAGYDGPNLYNSFAAWPYFGSGSETRLRPNTSGLPLSTDLYRMEDGNAILESNMPFGLFKSVAYSLGDELYVVGGLKENLSPFRNILKYDPTLKTWKEISGPTFPVSMDYPSFTYEGHGYYLGEDNMLYRYLPLSNEWESVIAFPSVVGLQGISQVIGDKLYVGIFESSKSLWELDLKELIWKRKTTFIGDFRSKLTSHWTDNGDIYILRHNLSSGSQTSVLWKFGPEEF